MLTVERVVEVIKSRCDGRDDPLLVFWCQTANNREEMCRQIEVLRGEANIVPLVPRGVGFDNPNALLADLNRLICEHKEQFLAEGISTTGNTRPIALLLLSRTEFTLPQIASLTVLPHWFPRVGGESVYIAIEDLSRTADGPMNVQEAHVGDLCEKLFQLDVALASRLAKVAQWDHSLNISFFASVRKPNEELAEFLEAARRYHVEVRNPQAYRPSVREGRSLIGRLLSLMQNTTPEQIGRRAKALTDALWIKDEEVRVVNDSIISVVLRPTNRDVSPAVRFTRNLIATVYASAQFVTAAAHADNYPNYQILLLRSLSYNLRTTLDDITRVLDRLDDPSAAAARQSVGASDGFEG